MKKLFALMMTLLLCQSIKAGDVEVFNGLVGRLLPNLQQKIEAKQLPAKTTGDYFTLQTKRGKLIVGGNNANSMAVGLNYYLKYYCNTTVSWFKDDKFLAPTTLPAIEKPIEINARVPQRFFLNYCTFGYTMPWWNWDDWEHFIDWMALNGVNLPLAITGQESIWLKVWTKLGLSEKEVRHYFTGPSHLPWHRMLNIDYWQGDLPMSWLNDQEDLQKKIVAREREFNMKPVLPAFAGHVPAELKRIYPDAKITKLKPWSGYSEEYACSYLDPMDPLFTQIQREFLTIQNATYGTDHIYGIDLFNELEPPSWDASYLRRVAKQTYENLKAVDEDAVWLQMAWLFYNDRKYWTDDRIEAYVTAYPAEKSILLDYYCERKEVWNQVNQFHGVPYIWCYLGNFGGNTALFGNIKDVNERLENTFVNGGDNFQGIGSTIEGFDCNTFMYEYVFEKAWDFDTHKDVKKWIQHVADERSGVKDEHIREAWQILAEKIYIAPDRPGQCSMWNVRPALNKKWTTYYHNLKVPYDNRDLLHAIECLLQGKSDAPFYHLDVVNFTRQLLGNYSAVVYDKYNEAVKARNLKEMMAQEKLMLDLINDADRLLATENTFLMGKWIADARKKGTTAEEKLYFERNARNLLTTWGEKAHLLNDYASRSWNGTLGTFYAQRWKLFFAAVTDAVIAGEEFDEQRAAKCEKTITDFEEKWWHDCIGDFPSKPVGDGVSIARELVAKYKPLIEAVPAPKK